jgi:hypothetical protein
MIYGLRHFTTTDNTPPPPPDTQGKEFGKLDASKIGNLVKPNVDILDVKGNINRVKCFKIIEKVRTKKKFESQEIAMAMITGLVQNGGSNKSAGNTIFERNGLTLSSNEFHSCIIEFEKNGTIRQFARTMADDVIEFARAMEEEGDLAKQIKLQYSDLNIEDLIWCSNFQTKNPNCPKKIKNWLVENYNKRFRT